MDARIRERLETYACTDGVCLLVREPAGRDRVAGTPAAYADPDTPAPESEPLLAGMIIAPMLRPGAFPQRRRQHASDSWRRYLERQGVRSVEELNRLASDGAAIERVETDEDSPYFGALMRRRRPVVDGVRLAGVRAISPRGEALSAGRLAERLDIPLIERPEPGPLRAIVPVAASGMRAVGVLLRSGLDLARLGETIAGARGPLKVSGPIGPGAEFGVEEFRQLAERAGG